MGIVRPPNPACSQPFHPNRDAREDTSEEHNPLYKNVHEAQFFGRGNIAGIDVSAQKKEKGKFYENILELRRTQAEKEQEERRLAKVNSKNSVVVR